MVVSDGLLQITICGKRVEKTPDRSDRILAEAAEGEQRSFGFIRSKRWACGMNEAN